MTTEPTKEAVAAAREAAKVPFTVSHHPVTGKAQVAIGDAKLFHVAMVELDAALTASEAREAAKDARIEKLEAQNVLLRDGLQIERTARGIDAIKIRQAEDKAATLEAENAKLREALTPFVQHYEKWMDAWPDNDRCFSSSVTTFGDVRKARALVSP